MLKILKENYKISIGDYKEYNGGIIFFYKDYFYYFNNYNRNEYRMEKINEIIEISEKNNIKLNTIVPNLKGEIFSENYVLIKINSMIDEITVNDIEQFSKVKANIIVNDFVRFDKLWEYKLDNLEKKVYESGNKLIKKSFDYYLGISEVLIKYFKSNYRNENNRLVLSHNKMTTIGNIEFYNPLRITYDYYLKDYASYIRIKKEYGLIKNMLRSTSANERVYLFVRLVYPFEYFFKLEDLLGNKKEIKKENELINIIHKLDEYESYLSLMEKIFNIHIFSWLKKE